MNEASMALAWWLALQLFGLAALPLTFRLFRGLPDSGWAFARPLGLLLVAFVFWHGVTLGVIGNNRQSVLAALLAVAAVSWLSCRHEAASLRSVLRAQKWQIAIVELLFVGAFAFFTFVRSYTPELGVNEKPMELAFLNGVLRSERFPPVDPWLSGFPISYYYFGYIITAVLARFVDLPAHVAFNLMLPAVFALAATGAYTVGSDLCAGARSERSPGRQAVASGGLAVVLVVLLANLVTAVEILNALGLLPDRAHAFLVIKDLPAGYESRSFFPPDPGWWARSSRVVWTPPVPPNPSPGDYTINEFPFFSFLIGDLHPHVLALPFALLLIGFLLSAIRAPLIDRVRPRLEVGRILAMGVMFGSMGFLSSWDLPTHLFLLALVLGLHAVLSARAGGLRTVLWAALSIGPAVVLSFLLYLPFYQSFAAQSQAYGLKAVPVPTQAQHFLLFWGPLYLLTVTFILSQAPRPAGRLGAVVGAAMLLVAAGAAFRYGPVVALTAPLLVLTAALVIGHLRCRTPEPPREHLFALIVLFTGWLLVLVCDLVYVHDLFGGRTNTVFKLYYQAWLLLGLAGSYMVAFLLGLTPRPAGHGVPGRLARLGRLAWTGGLMLLFGSTLLYPVGATMARTNGFAGARTLDGLAFWRAAQPDDMAAIEWLSRTVRGTPVVATAAGDSYDFGSGRVATTTGLPTPIGWLLHERQFRGGPGEVDARQLDVDRIFGCRRGPIAPLQPPPPCQAVSDDPRQVMELLDRYAIAYLYVGPIERQTYGPDGANLDRFRLFMDVAYQNGGVTIYRTRGSAG